MLAVGNGDKTENEARVHLSMSCMLAVPLMDGNDLRNMTFNDNEILNNKALIAVNKDVIGEQGFKIEDFGNFEIWQKPLSNGDIAICLFNRDTANKTYNFDWKSVCIKDFNGVYCVKDLWKNKGIGTTKQNYVIEVPASDVVVFRLQKNVNSK